MVERRCPAGLSGGDSCGMSDLGLAAVGELQAPGADRADGGDVCVLPVAPKAAVLGPLESAPATCPASWSSSAAVGPRAEIDNVRRPVAHPGPQTEPDAVRVSAPRRPFGQILSLLRLPLLGAGPCPTGGRHGPAAVRGFVVTSHPGRPFMCFSRRVIRPRPRRRQPTC